MRTLALVGALLLAGCTESDEAPSPHGSADPGAGVEKTPDGEAVTLPPKFLECGEDDPTRAAEDLSGFSYETPTGFSTRGGFRQIIPAEGAHTDTYLVPEASTSLDVLALVHYPQLEHGPVTDQCGVLDLELVAERIEDRRQDADADRVGTLSWEEIDGSPAAVDHLIYPAYGFDVLVYWIYGVDQLLVVSCQWVDAEEVIAAGCAELLDSLRLS